jgi:hypothetical protein
MENHHRKSESSQLKMVDLSIVMLNYRRVCFVDSNKSDFLGKKKVNLSVIKIVVKSDWSLWFRRVKSSSWCFKPCRIHQQLCINDVYLRMIHPLDDGWLINQRSYQVTCKNKKRWWHMMTSQFSDLLKLNGPDNHQPNQHPIKCIHMPNCCLSQH